MQLWRAAFLAAMMVLSLRAARADAPRQSLDDAWWTGPLLAAAAGSLPLGHFLFEPYFFDSVPYASVDAHGHSHPTAPANEFGSMSYVLYGLAPDFTVGFIPRFGFEEAEGEKSTAAVNLGDWTVQGQYQLTQFQEGHWLPTMSVNVSEVLPLGHYQRLDRPTDGSGAGAYTTILSLYSQSFFWMPGGRLLRPRLDLSYAFSTSPALHDVSVYGTEAGFQGHADPGASAYGDLGLEYSITRNWVAAMDVWLEQDGNTRVAGTAPASGGKSLLPVLANSGTGYSLYLAPAVEYNVNGALGVILGARIFAFGRNETALATPVVAINYVH